MSKEKTERQKFISDKLHEIKKMGVRKNTHAPVSKSNPRRQVSHDQAVAIALSEARKKS